MQQSAERNDRTDTPGDAKPSTAVAVRDDTSPASEPLFRSEVVAERQAQWLGAVLLEPRLSHHAFATAALIALAAILALLNFGSYTRKARVNGWLVPNSGLIKVFAPQTGIVTEIRVREGQRVEKDAPLMTISAEVRSEALGATRQNITNQLILRRDNLSDEQANQERLFSEQAADLHSRIATMGAERDHLTRELEIERARLALANKTLGRFRQLQAHQLIALPRVEQAQQDAMELAARIETLERQRAAQQNELQQTEASVRQLSSRRQTQIGEIIRNRATVEQELAEAETRRQVLITAPHDGVVSGIQAERGGAVNTNAPLLNIVPVNSKLEAQIFSSSRAIGFLHAGQRVLLRYQSFPYQKFGSYEGTVAEVSRSAISPSELGQSFVGLTSLYGTNEPVYRITVALDKQSVLAYGQTIPLKPGMQLEADVLIEKRHLIEWILDPLYTITGK